MTLLDAELEKKYSIKEIKSDDEELVKFLFSLGCYSGEDVSVISRKKNNLLLSIKGARYNIDKELGAAILI